MIASQKVQYGPTAQRDRCRVCGASLTRRAGPGRPRIVHIQCSAEANRRRSADRRVNGPKTRRCEVCASELPHSRGCSRYCSPKCRRAGANALRKARRHASAESAPIHLPS
jgi:hypothetical protein